MCKENQSCQESITTTDNESLPVEDTTYRVNKNLAENENVVFLCAESKTDNETADLEIEYDKNEEYIVITETETMHSHYLEDITEQSKFCAKYVYSATSIYFFWILMHYFSAQLYVYYCTPQGFYGFFISPFLVAAPHCRALRWIIHSGGNMVDNMWIILGTWLCSKMLLNK